MEQRKSSKKRARGDDHEEAAISENAVGHSPLQGLFDVGIFDEGPKLKSRQTQTHHFAHALQYRVVMTASINPNKPVDFIGALLVLWKPELKYDETLTPHEQFDTTVPARYLLDLFELDYGSSRRTFVADHRNRENTA